MDLRVKRVYEAPSPEDGLRVLVDRLWPRGLSKEKARVDLWIRTAAPSDELRRWYGHDHDKWPEFRRRYFAELEAAPEALEPLVELDAPLVTLLFGSREPDLNNARALREYLEERPRARRRHA